jgi:carboxymethylenebutenolidase
MSEKEIEIKTGDGVCDGVFYHPDGEGPWPGVLYLTDILGIGAASSQSASRLAQQGYAVLMPNILYRTGRAPLKPSLQDLDGDARGKRLAELTGPLTPEAMEEDDSAYVDFLTAHDRTGKGMIGVVGHCFTGKMALHAAAARPGKVAAVASFHGGGLYTDASTSPHLLLPRIKARLYFGHATEDRGMPAEAVTKLEEALKRWGGQYESETYRAHHGWTSADSPSYNPDESERAFKKLGELLRETLH